MPPRINPGKLARRIYAKLEASGDPRIQKPYIRARQITRRVVNLVTPLQLGWVSTLLRARWLDGTTYEISGWAFERGFGFPNEEPQIEVSLHARGLPPLQAKVTHYLEPLANTRVKKSNIDYSNTGFVAHFDVAEITAQAGDKLMDWRLLIRVSGNGHTASGSFRRRRGLSSAFYPLSRTFDGVQVTPKFVPSSGFGLRVQKVPVLATSAAVFDRMITADLALAGINFADAELVSAQGSMKLDAVFLSDGTVRVSGSVPEIDPLGRTVRDDPNDDEGFFENASETALPVLTHTIRVRDNHGRSHLVYTALDPADESGWGERPPYIYPGPDGSLRLRDTSTMVLVTKAEVEQAPVLGVRVSGVVLGDMSGAKLALVGARARREMSLTINEDRSFTGFAPWLASNWGQSDLPPMSGLYTLQGQTTAGREFLATATANVIERAPVRYNCPGFNVSMGISPGRNLSFRLTAPLADDEIGSFNQTRLKSIYQSPNLPVATQFYFESFQGKQATCNPLALDRELARRFPDIPRYWGVVDASIQVPEGSIPVIAGTQAWWKARHTSRYVISNEWLKSKYQHLPHQIVLQTWHGSMLKTIGLDREGIDILTQRSLLSERTKWDYLLSQNPHSTKIFRTAYDWDKPIWEEGYPRNDALATESGAPTRKLLGIAEGQKAILYAPTWRESQTEMVTFLDAERLAADLGQEYVILLRGHSRTLKFGADVHVPGVIDVTSYPNITDLFLASDALVTDYSSVMFDFSNTGRPMIFFAPDMDEYRDSERGVYFDLLEVAPGPVLATQDEVLQAVQQMEVDKPNYRAKYDSWQARFNPYDDGHCAERIIDRLLALS